MRLSIAACVLMCAGCSTVHPPSPPNVPEPVSPRRTLTLSWEPPTRNADGTALTDLSHYIVYADGRPVARVQAGLRTYRLVLSLERSVEIYMTAIDYSGNESEPSNRVIVAQEGSEEHGDGPARR